MKENPNRVPMSDKPIKIRLTTDLPIAEEHGAVIGAEFAVLRYEGCKTWFMGKAGKECATFEREYEIIKE